MITNTAKATLIAAESPLFGNVRFKYDVENSKAEYYKRHFNSFEDFLHYVSYNHNELERYDSHKGSYDFTRTTSFEQAIKYAEGGWKEGLKEINYYENISDLEYGSQALKNIWDVENDVTGDFVDIESYIQGVPECMARFNEKRDKKFADIFVKTDYNCYVKQEDVFRRGVEILKMVDALEKHGIKTRVTGYVVAKSWRSKREIKYLTTVVLKDYHQQLELDYLVFPLAHVSFLRRLWFAMLEKEDIDFRKKFQGKSLIGYGGCGMLGEYPDLLWKEDIHGTRLFVIDDPASSVYSEEAIKRQVKEVLKAS